MSIRQENNSTPGKEVLPFVLNPPQVCVFCRNQQTYPQTFSPFQQKQPSQFFHTECFLCEILLGFRMQVGYEKIMVSTNISLCLRTMGHSYYGLSIGTRTEQGHCGACRRKWRLTDTDLCPCGETQTMSHIVESCPLTKLNGGLSWLHSADEDAVSWLTNYG